MSKAVRFKEYGGIDVLEVVDVERPVPGDGQVLVRVRAAAINPGEVHIREGLLHHLWPATFPSGEGSDLAGVVAALGPEAELVGAAPGKRSTAVAGVSEAEAMPAPATEAAIIATATPAISSPRTRRLCGAGPGSSGTAVGTWISAM